MARKPDDALLAAQKKEAAKANRTASPKAKQSTADKQTVAARQVNDAKSLNSPTTGDSKKKKSKKNQQIVAGRARHPNEATTVTTTAASNVVVGADSTLESVRELRKSSSSDSKGRKHRSLPVARQLKKKSSSSSHSSKEHTETILIAARHSRSKSSSSSSSNSAKKRHIPVMKEMEDAAIRRTHNSTIIESTTAVPNSCSSSDMTGNKDRTLTIVEEKFDPIESVVAGVKVVEEVTNQDIIENGVLKETIITTVTEKIIVDTPASTVRRRRSRRSPANKSTPKGEARWSAPVVMAPVVVRKISSSSSSSSLKKCVKKSSSEDSLEKQVVGGFKKSSSSSCSKGSRKIQGSAPGSGTIPRKRRTLKAKSSVVVVMSTSSSSSSRCRRIKPVVKVPVHPRSSSNSSMKRSFSSIVEHAIADVKAAVVEPVIAVRGLSMDHFSSSQSFTRRCPPLETNSANNHLTRLSSVSSSDHMLVVKTVRRPSPEDLEKAVIKVTQNVRKPKRSIFAGCDVVSSEGSDDSDYDERMHGVQTDYPFSTSHTVNYWD